MGKRVLQHLNSYPWVKDVIMGHQNSYSALNVVVNNEENAELHQRISTFRPLRIISSYDRISSRRITDHSSYSLEPCWFNISFLCNLHLLVNMENSNTRILNNRKTVQLYANSFVNHIKG